MYGTQLAAKMNKENLESVFIAFLLKRRKCRQGLRPRSGKSGPQRGASVFAVRTIFSLVAMLVRIHEVSDMDVCTHV